MYFLRCVCTKNTYFLIKQCDQIFRNRDTVQMEVSSGLVVEAHTIIITALILLDFTRYIFTASRKSDETVTHTDTSNVITLWCYKLNVLSLLVPAVLLPWRVSNKRQRPEGWSNNTKTNVKSLRGQSKGTERMKLNERNMERRENRRVKEGGIMLNGKNWGSGVCLFVCLFVSACVGPRQHSPERCHVVDKCFRQHKHTLSNSCTLFQIITQNIP